MLHVENLLDPNGICALGCKAVTRRRGHSYRKNTRVSDSLLTQSPWCSLAGCCATEHFKLPASLFFLVFFWQLPLVKAHKTECPRGLLARPLKSVSTGHFWLLVRQWWWQTNKSGHIDVHLSSNVSSIKTATRPTQAQGSEWTGHSWVCQRRAGSYNQMQRDCWRCRTLGRVGVQGSKTPTGGSGGVELW